MSEQKQPWFVSRNHCGQAKVSWPPGLGEPRSAGASSGAGDCGGQGAVSTGSTVGTEALGSALGSLSANTHICLCFRARDGAERCLPRRQKAGKCSGAAPRGEVGAAATQLTS